MTGLNATNWGWRHSGRKSWAVHSVSLDIPRGQRVLLLGASGSGKSSLLHGIAGLLSTEEGEAAGSLTLDGLATSAVDSRARIGLVQQDPDSQVVMENIGDEVAFGCENLGLDREEIWQRAQDALAMVELNLPLDHPTEELSGGQKQRLAVAASLAMRPEVLLLDEPTANLDPTGVQLVRTAVERVAQSGMTLVIIEHRVDTWADLVDRVIVLDGGEVIADGSPSEVLQRQAETLLAAGIWVPGHDLPITPLNDGPAGPAAAWTEELAVGYRKGEPVLSELSLSFPQGQSTCILGSNGAGKSTLALTLAGLLSPLAGEVAYAAADGSPDGWSSRELVKRVAMVFQEPSYQFLTSTVEEELATGLRQSDLSAAERQARVAHFLDQMKLTPLARAHPLSLSGGEKRRLSVASALISAPPVVILDEPTFGQDRNTWISLVEVLQDLVRQGTTLISITHDQTYARAVGQHVVNADNQPLAPRNSAAQARPSAIDRVNPVTRLAGLALMTLPMFATVDVVSGAVALALILLALPLTGMGPRTVLRRVWPLFLASPMAALSMLLYARPGGEVFWTLGPASITQNSVQLATAIAIRVLAIGIPGIVILSGARPTEMADALTQVGRLPSRPVYATLAGIRLASLMFDDWRALQRARRSRGVGDGSRLRAFFQGLFALFTFALRRAGTLSITMEARGFGSPIPRTFARPSTAGHADLVMLAISAAIPTAAIGLAIWAGAFRWFGM